MVAVENGKLAIEELKKEDANFDIVLLDLMMPEIVRLTHSSTAALSLKSFASGWL